MKSPEPNLDSSEAVSNIGLNHRKFGIHPMFQLSMSDMDNKGIKLMFTPEFATLICDR